MFKGTWLGHVDTVFSTDSVPDSLGFPAWPGLVHEPTYKRTYKIRCLHCGQKQDNSNDDCQFCGAPLPD